MIKPCRKGSALAVASILLSTFMSPSVLAKDDMEATAISHPNRLEKGRYLYQVANCYACHTDTENDGKPLAGGRKLESEFGIFYTPNITADPESGIGNWSDDDFITAMTDGVSPDGKHYYPAFPYLSYRDMDEQDILAIKAYIFSLPVIEKQNRDHELVWFASRIAMPVWKWLNDLSSAPVARDDSRGSYLIDTLGHCNECHTPRNALGMLRMQHRLEGNDDLSAPDISATADGIGDWSRQQLADLFQYGELPDGDYVADHMGDVVDYATSKWTEQDLEAAIDYLHEQ